MIEETHERKNQRMKGWTNEKTNTITIKQTLYVFMTCIVSIYSLGPVCPLPKALNGSRHVGGVNVITCLPHEHGGGTATCRDNLTWDVDLQPCRR